MSYCANLWRWPCRVNDRARFNSILWLWTTNHHIRKAFEVIDAWGFAYKTLATWDKGRMGMGDWLRSQTEHVIMAVRGNPIVNLTTETTLLRAPRRSNSEKPDEFYELVEGLCPAPRYAELFARRARPKWDGHGNEMMAPVAMVVPK